MLWFWLALEWYTGQLTLDTPFKLDVILIDDVSSKQEDRFHC